MIRHRVFFRVFPTALLMAAVVGACTVVEQKADEITIEHLANQFAVAEYKAENYCAERGQVAEHVMTGPRSSGSLLLMQSSTSVFKCVPPKPKK